MDWIEGLALALPDAGWLPTVFLLSLRLGTLLLLTPLLHAASMPPSVRVLFVIGLAAALTWSLRGASWTAPAGWAALLSAAAWEVALGITLAIGLHAAFAAVSMAGRLIDVQAGFGMAQVFDPASQRQIPVLSAAFAQLGVLMFFLLDAHHALLRALAFSLERFPPGRPWALAGAAPMVMRQIGAMFSLGLALAAPVLACLLLAELVLGVLARNLPQANLFVIGMPIKVMVALAMLALWSVGMNDAVSRIYVFIFSSWESGWDAMRAQGLR